MVINMTQRIHPFSLGEEMAKNPVKVWSVEMLTFNPLAEPWKINRSKGARPLDMGLDLANGGWGA